MDQDVWARAPRAGRGGWDGLSDYRRSEYVRNSVP